MLDVHRSSSAHHILALVFKKNIHISHDIAEIKLPKQNKKNYEFVMICD